MALARARREVGINYWPGFVDALATLILGIVFPLIFKYRHDPEKMVHISPVHSAG